MLSKISYDYLKEDNKYLTLYVDISNPSSNKAYSDIGYKYITNLVNYNLKGE